MNKIKRTNNRVRNIFSPKMRSPADTPSKPSKLFSDKSIVSIRKNIYDANTDTLSSGKMSHDYIGRYVIMPDGTHNICPNKLLPKQKNDSHSTVRANDTFKSRNNDSSIR